MLDWLKTLVWERPSPGKRRPVPGRNRVWFGGRVFPLLAIDQHGLVADQVGGSLTEPGHRVKVKVHVDDLYGSFSFSSLVNITKTTNAMFSGAWWMMLPEHQQVLVQYDRAKRKAMAAAEAAAQKR